MDFIYIKIEYLEIFENIINFTKKNYIYYIKIFYNF